MHATLEAFLQELTHVSVTSARPVDEKEPAAPGDVWVGRTPANFSDDGDQPFIVINNKITSHRFGGSYPSVARMLWVSDDKRLAAWSQCPAPSTGPGEALAAMRLVVEDASPDSVLGVILLLMRIAGLSMAAEMETWVTAVDAWKESGNVDCPATSWCALGAALAHSHFPVGKTIEAADYGRAWTDMLRFTATCMLAGDAPDAVVRRPQFALWQLAETALDQEHALYLDWLQHATKLQLALPIVGMEDRSLMVDALLITEDQPTGATKVYYRNDQVNAPLGKGFTLAAQYRAAADPGNRYTITVDTRRGVHLRPLWDELERREEAAWKGAGQRRPNANPRVLEDVNDHDQWVDQPWYLNKNASLIGDPYRQTGGGPGSRLSWEEVQDAIWTVFNPLNGIRVRCDTTGEMVPIGELQPAEAAPHKKHLLLAHWSDGSSDPGVRALPTAEIVPRFLAALIGRGQNRRMPRLSDLPQPGSWTQVSLRGGFAIVTTAGLFVLNDWRSEQLELDPIRKTFTTAAVLDHKLQELQTKEVERLAKEVQSALAGRRNNKKLETLAHRAAIIAAQMAGLRGSDASPPTDLEVLQVWDALSTCWGLERRLAALEAEVQSIETSVRSVERAHASRVMKFVGVFGLPVTAGASLCVPVGQFIAVSIFGRGGDQTSMFALSSFVVISCLLSLFFWLWLRFGGRR